MARVVLLRLLRSQSRQASSTNLLSAYHCSRTWTCGPPLNAYPTSNPSSPLAAAQKRWRSQATTAEEDYKISFKPSSWGQPGQDDKESEVVYYGQFSSSIKKFRLQSLSLCCVSASVFPFMNLLPSPDMILILGSSFLLFSCATITLAHHWLFKAYIHKLKWQPGSDRFEVEMMSWLGTCIRRTIKFADIRPETRIPLVTFKANGNFYFVQREHCHDRALLACPAPQEVTHESEDDYKISFEPYSWGQHGQHDEESEVVYYGPWSSYLQKMRLQCLSVCCLSGSLVASITFLTSPDMILILGSSFLIFSSAAITAAHHWLYRTYVHELRWQAGSDRFEVEMMSWLGTCTHRTIKFADIRSPETDDYFATFEANGNFYFVDPFNCHNEALLARLIPPYKK